MNQAIERHGHDARRDDRAIDRLLATLVDSWNRRDWVAFGGCFSQTADYVTGEAARWSGRAGIVQGMERLAAIGGTGGRATLTDRTIRHLGPEVAVVHLAWRLENDESSARPASLARNGVTVLVLAAREGDWLIEAAQNTDAPSAPPLPPVLESPA